MRAGQKEFPADADWIVHSAFCGFLQKEGNLHSKKIDGTGFLVSKRCTSRRGLRGPDVWHMGACI